MKFWLTVGGLLLVGFFCLRSCAGKLMGGGKVPSVVPATLAAAAGSGARGGDLSAASGGPMAGAVVPAEKSVPRAVRFVHFLHRDPPAELQAAATSAQCVAAVDSVARVVLVSGPVDSVDSLCRYCAELDVMPGACSVRCWAVYVDRSMVKGWDLVAAIKSVSGIGSGPSSLKVGSGGLTLDLSVGDVAAALDVVCDGSVVDVLQRPHVQLLHGVTSKIESLQEIPVPSTTVSQGISQTSIQYRKVGLQLEITPKFLAGDRVRLECSQTNGLIGQNVKIGDNQIPVISSQSVSSSVEMSVGQTVVLGGVSTLRQKVVRGLLRDTREVTEGALYLILSLYSDLPRAVVVRPGALADPPVVDDLPLLPPMDDPREWIDGKLCSVRPVVSDWSPEEMAVVRSKSLGAAAVPVKKARFAAPRRN